MNENRNLMTLEDYLPCPRCGSTARFVGLDRTPMGMRKKYRCSSCGWEFYAG